MNIIYRYISKRMCLDKNRRPTYLIFGIPIETDGKQATLPTPEQASLSSNILGL